MGLFDSTGRANTARTQRNAFGGPGHTRHHFRVPANQMAPQHFLNLRPLPQGQGSFRPTFGLARRYGSTLVAGEGSKRRGASSG
jgi:hypothetical protein